MKGVGVGVVECKTEDKLRQHNQTNAVPVDRNNDPGALNHHI